jgi:hypothetical protein
MTVAANKSLQRTWLSRLQFLPGFVCSRFSRHAAQLRSVRPPLVAGWRVAWAYGQSDL